MNDQTAVALEVYKGLRTEIVERIKLRDQILLAYMGAVITLIGFSVKEAPQQQSLLKASMVLLPFLAIGAAGAIVQHQEMVTSLVKYYASTLLRFLPAGATAVTPYEHADTATDMKRSLNLVSVTQLTMICGPFIFAAAYTGYTSYLVWRAASALVLLACGFVLTCIASTILWQSRNYRKRMLEALQKEGDVLRANSFL